MNSPHHCTNAVSESKWSSGRIKQIVKVVCIARHPIKLDARQSFHKTFLEHPHVKNFNQIKIFLEKQCVVLRLRYSLLLTKAQCLRSKNFQALTIKLILVNEPKRKVA